MKSKGNNIQQNRLEFTKIGLLDRYIHEWTNRHMLFIELATNKGTSEFFEELSLRIGAHERMCDSISAGLKGNLE